MIGWLPSFDLAGSGGRDGFACRCVTDVSFARRGEHTPEAQRSGIVQPQDVTTHRHPGKGKVSWWASATGKRRFWARIRVGWDHSTRMGT